MNGNMNLGKRVTALEKDGGADIKKEISDLQVAVVEEQVKISNLENKVNSGKVYSTEEKVVATWTDGRPVYEKTIHVSDPRVIGEPFEITFLENIDFLVNHSVMFKDVNQNGAKFILANYTGTAASWYSGNQMYINSNNALLFRFDGAGGGLEIFGVIQYTKTTDTPTS